MSDSVDKALRGAELGIKAGYLIAFGVVAYFLYQLFGPSKQKRIDIPPPVPPGDVPAPPHSGGTGLRTGGAVTGVDASIIDPPNGGEVNRHLFRGTFPVTLEIVSSRSDEYQVVVTVEAIYDDGLGNVSEPVVSALGPFMIAAQQVTHITADVETGLGWLSLDIQGLAGVFTVKTNDIITQTTAFKVN